MQVYYLVSLEAVRLLLAVTPYAMAMIAMIIAIIAIHVSLEGAAVGVIVELLVVMAAWVT